MFWNRVRGLAGAARWAVMPVSIILLAGCGGGGGGGKSHPLQTFDATFSNPAGTNATTTPMNLSFTVGGQNGTTNISSAYLGGFGFIGSTGGSPNRTITINTITSSTAAGQVLNISPNGTNTLVYTEGNMKWAGTGTITINSVNTATTEVRFTAHATMQPDTVSPGGATGTFTLDVTGGVAAFGV